MLARETQTSKYKPALISHKQIDIHSQGWVIHTLYFALLIFIRRIHDLRTQLMVIGLNHYSPVQISIYREAVRDMSTT